MKVTTYSEAKPVSSSTLLRVVMCLDIGIAVAFTLLWWSRQPDDAPWTVLTGIVLFGTLTMLTGVGCLGLRASMMVWRRRLGLVAVIIVIWRGGSFSELWLQSAVLFWNAFIWMVLLFEARRVAHVVAEATGEEVLQADPERPVR